MIILPGDVKNGFKDCLIRTVPDIIRVPFPRKQGFYRIDNQRFTGPCFSGEHVQTPAGLPVYLLDDTKISDA